MDDWEVEEISDIASKLKQAASKAGLANVSDNEILTNAVEFYLQDREFANRSEDEEESEDSEEDKSE